MTGISGFSPYVPLYRIDRASVAEQFGDRAPEGETAVPAHDETVVSLAARAAGDARRHAGVDGLETVYAASVTDPFDERGLAGQVASALGALGDVTVADFGGSARAATNALVAGADAVAAGRGPALVVAADVVPAVVGDDGESTAGAGAGAVVLGETGEVATLVEARSNTTGFVGGVAPAGEPRTSGHPRFDRLGYVEAVGEVLDGLEAAPDHVALPAPHDGWPERAIGGTDVDADHHATFDAVGWAGAASSLLDLSLALERAAAGETVALVGYGPGGCDALVVEAGVAVSSAPETSTADYLASKEYVTYAKHHTYRERARGER